MISNQFSCPEKERYVHSLQSTEKTYIGYFASSWISLSLYTSAVLQQSHLRPCYVSAITALMFLWVFLVLKSSWFWRKGKAGILVPQKPWSFPSRLARVSGCPKAPPAGEKLFILGLVSWEGRIWVFEDPLKPFGRGAWHGSWAGGVLLPRWAAFVPADGILHCVGATLILARDGAGSLAEAFLETCQEISKETHAPQRQEVMYLAGTGDKCRKPVSLELGWCPSLCEPQSFVSARASGWGGRLGHRWDLWHGAVHAGQRWREGKTGNVIKTGWVLDAFIFQHIPVLRNLKVNALGRHLTKTSSSSVKRLVIDQVFIEMWRQLIWMHLCKVCAQELLKSVAHTAANNSLCPLSQVLTFSWMFPPWQSFSGLWYPSSYKCWSAFKFQRTNLAFSYEGVCVLFT